MAVRQGATDAQIVDALQKELPHLTDPASLQVKTAGKQTDGTGTAMKDRKADEQKKRRSTASQATEAQPSFLAAEAFDAALEAIPAEDWCRTWAAGGASGRNPE
jgi:hypothetical protein